MSCRRGRLIGIGSISLDHLKLTSGTAVHINSNNLGKLSINTLTREVGDYLNVLTLGACHITPWKMGFQIIS